MAARDQPSGIEPTVGLTVIRQPVDVPMADEGRIGGIYGRAAADEHDAARKARQHVSRPVGGINLDDVAVLEGKVWYGDEGAMTHDEHVAARQLEETLDVGDIFAAAIALPRQTATEAELTAATDGNDGADVAPALLASQAMSTAASRGISVCDITQILNAVKRSERRPTIENVLDKGACGSRWNWKIVRREYRKAECRSARYLDEDIRNHKHSVSATFGHALSNFQTLMAHRRGADQLSKAPAL